MKNLTIIFLLFALVLWRCQNTQTALSNAEKEQIETEVKAEFQNLVESIRQLDFDKWSSFYSAEYFTSSVNGRMGYITNYEEWMKTVNESFAQRSRHESETHEVNVTALNSDMALLTYAGIWENWWSDHYSKANGLATYLWKKENGQWKIIHVHESIRQNADIIGAWNLVTYKSINDGSLIYSFPNGNVVAKQIKIWTNGHFTFSGEFELDGEKMDNYGGGSYNMNGNISEEHIEYFASKPSIGTTVKLRMEFKGDTLVQTYPVDANYNVDENHYSVEKYIRLD